MESEERAILFEIPDSLNAFHFSIPSREPEQLFPRTGYAFGNSSMLPRKWLATKHGKK